MPSKQEWIHNIVSTTYRHFLFETPSLLIMLLEEEDMHRRMCCSWAKLFPTFRSSGNTFGCTF